MAKNIILWALLCIVIDMLIGCEIRYSNGHAEAPPAEYRLMCDTETKRAYVTYKHWSAHVPNADKFCVDSQVQLRPTIMVM